MASKKAIEVPFVNSDLGVINEMLDDEVRAIVSKSYEVQTCEADFDNLSNVVEEQASESNTGGAQDSDIDDLDFENFKGIHFEDDNGLKYTDPETGSHFEYNDFCCRLVKLKEFRKQIDIELGLSTPKANDNNIEKTQVNNSKKEQNVKPQQQRQQQHLPKEIVTQIQAQNMGHLNNHILTLQKRQIKRDRDNQQKSQNGGIIHPKVDILGKFVQQSINKPRVNGKEGRNASLKRNEQQVPSLNLPQKFVQQNQYKDNNNQGQGSQNPIQEQHKDAFEQYVEDNIFQPRMTQSFENPIIKQKFQDRYTTFEKKRQIELDQLYQLCQSYMGPLPNGRMQAESLYNTFNSGISKSKNLKPIQQVDFNLTQDIRPYQNQLEDLPSRKRIKSSGRNFSLEIGNMNTTKLDVDTLEKLSPYIMKQKNPSMDYKNIPKNPQALKVVDHLNISVKNSGYSRNINNDQLKPSTFNLQLTQDLLMSVQKNQQLINNIKNGTRNFNNSINKAQTMNNNNKIIISSRNRISVENAEQIFKNKPVPQPAIRGGAQKFQTQQQQYCNLLQMTQDGRGRQGNNALIPKYATQQIQPKSTSNTGGNPSKERQFNKALGKFLYTNNKRINFYNN